MVLTTGIVCTIIVQKQVVVALVCWCVVELCQRLQGTPDVCGQLESAHQCPLISVSPVTLWRELWKELYEIRNYL